MFVTFSPSKECDDKESQTLWNILNGVLDRVSRGFRVTVLGDLNGLIGDR